MHLNRFVTTAVWMTLVGCIPAFGQFNVIGRPASTYTAGTSLVPVTAADDTAVSSITDGAQTITFSGTDYARTVPGSWSTWGVPPATESASPRVVAAFGATSLTMTLSVQSHTFGFEIEPNGSGSSAQYYAVSAQFYNGATLLGTVSQNINWQAGALLAAASDSDTITSVVVTAPVSANGFAMAQFRYGSTLLAGVARTPLPGTFFMGGLGMMMLAAGALLSRSRMSAEP